MKIRILFWGGILLLVGLSLILLGNRVGNASEFPSRPVEVIINFGAGGPLDLAVRLMGEELSKSLGVSAILTNKGGGGGAVGAQYVARAKPDGYTILASSITTFTILPFMVADLRFRLSDFIPLCRYANSPVLIVVRKDSPYKSFEDLISYSKKNPGKLNCGTAGIGTATHLSLEIIKLQAGIDAAHMPYKSGGEMYTALLGGHVDFAFPALSVARGGLKSGDVRALASFTFERIKDLPAVATLAELGYPKANVLSGWGYFLPKGTPKPIVDKLASVFEKAMKNPTVERNLENIGQLPDYQDGPTFAKFLIEEYKLLEDVAKKAKLTK